MPGTESAAITRRGLVKAGAAVVAGAALPLPFVRPSRGQTQDPAVVGAWSPVYSWPDVAIHLHLLPNGKVLSFADDDVPGLKERNPGFVKAFVVDVPLGQPPGAVVEVFNNQTNLFCSGHTFLPDGRLFVTGGHAGQLYYGVADVSIFDPASQSWQTQSGYPINYARWYGTALTLASGEVLVLGGTVGGVSDPNPLPQVWQASGGFRDLTTAQLKLKVYPRIYLAPDGRVFHVGPEQESRFLDTAGTGRWTAGPRRQHGLRNYGPSVMYGDGTVLVLGGAKIGVPPTNTAEVIDLTVPAPAWRYTNPMRFARRHANATVLPDGKVLVTGGSDSVGFNDAAGAVLAAELWDPGPETWTTMASMAVPRIYHSAALLLPDGRVLSAGGGRPKAKNGGVQNENVEFYSPPYLFKGPRPTIASAPASVGYGQTFPVGTPDAAGIAAARFIRLASVTHTLDMNQRVKTLAFTPAPGGGLNVAVPSDPNLLPPGHYMLFIVNREGVPSTAPIIKVG
jgi:galactose oxidase